jgi:hypothetical protein
MMDGQFPCLFDECFSRERGEKKKLVFTSIFNVACESINGKTLETIKITPKCDGARWISLNEKC